MAAREKAKLKIDFNKMGVEDMVNYIKDHHHTESEEDKQLVEDFKSYYEMKDQKVYVGVFDANGQPVMYTDKSGKTRQKRKAVKKKGGQKKRVFNILAAKRWFYDSFKDEIDFSNPPKPKKAKKDDNEPTETERLIDSL